METKKLDNKVFLPQVIQLTKEGHSVTIVARGYSMMPFIEHNRDKLIFGKLRNAKEGDAVLAEINPGVFVCHRIESIQGNQVTLRGDGNIRGTESCTLDDLRAHLIGIVRNGKTYNLDNSNVWKLYSAIWPKLLPVRRILLVLYRLLWHGKLPRRWTGNNS